MVSPETLRRYSLFSGQSDKLLAKIAMLTANTEVPAGEWLFHQGQDAERLYLVLEGAVTLTMEINQHLHRMSPMGEGEVIGWSAMVAPNVYTLGAQAKEDTRAAAIDGRGLCDLFDEDPEAGYRFMQKLAEVIGERLNARDTQIVSMVV